MKKNLSLIFIFFCIIIFIFTAFNISSKNSVIKITAKNSDISLSEETMAIQTQKDLKVLVIEINPVLKTQNNIKASEYLGAKGDERAIINEVLEDLTYSSNGYLNCNVVDWIETDEFAPYTVNIDLLNNSKSNKLDEETWLHIMQDGVNKWDEYANQTLLNDYCFDYNYIIEKYNLIERKNNGDFDYVFLSAIEPVCAYESVMVGRTAYWINGSPITADCDNFPIILANITQKDGVLHSVGHMCEQTLKAVFGDKGSFDFYGSKKVNVSKEENYNKLNLFNKFVLSDYNSTGHISAGNVHFPPNADHSYDYDNSKIVYSDWKDWRDNYPNLTGALQPTSASDWQDLPETGDQSSNRGFCRWWMKLFPHLTGRNEDGYYHNWWKYITTFDYVTNITTNMSGILDLNVGNNNNKISYICTYQSGKSKSFESNSNLKIENSAIVTQDENGNLIGLKPGETVINIFRDGKKLSIPVRVLDTQNSADMAIDKSASVGNSNNSWDIYDESEKDSNNDFENDNFESEDASDDNDDDDLDDDDLDDDDLDDDDLDDDDLDDDDLDDDDLDEDDLDEDDLDDDSYRISTQSYRATGDYTLFSQGILPKTGNYKILLIILLIVSFSSIIIFFIKYRRIKDLFK